MSRARAVSTHPDRWWDGTPFDAILVDAPCSATGIVRRLVEGSVLPACVDTARARDMGNANRRRWWLLPGAATRECR